MREKVSVIDVITDKKVGIKRRSVHHRCDGAIFLENRRKSAASVEFCLSRKFNLLGGNMGYIEDLRKVIGHQPLILVGIAIAVINELPDQLNLLIKNLMKQYKVSV